MIATIGVLEALVLAGVGALHFYWAAGVGLPPGIPKGAARVGTSILAAVVIVRAVGDRKHVGFLKRVRDTEFARRDSRIYSPLCLLLGLGAAAIVVS